MVQTDLEPQNWISFSSAAHGLLEIRLDRLQGASSHSWLSVPEGILKSYTIGGTMPAAPVSDTRICPVECL